MSFVVLVYMTNKSNLTNPYVREFSLRKQV